MTTTCMLKICVYLSSYFVKLKTMFTILNILHATCSNGKQNIQFKHKKLIDNNAEESRVNCKVLMFNFPTF